MSRSPLAANQCKAVLVVARRLEDVHSGSGQYLKTYLEICRDAGLSTTLVFAPRRSFGNIAWSKVHPDIGDLVTRVDWAQTVQIGGRYISISPAVWAGFFKRLGHEFARSFLDRRRSSYPSLLGVELYPREAKATLQRVAAQGAHVATAEYSSLAPLLNEMKVKKKIVFLHDLFSLRAENFRSQGMDPDHHVLTLEQEAARCQAADLLIHASRVEEALLQSVLPNANHVWMRPSVSAKARVAPSRSAPHAVFVGSKHAGNVQALSFLRTKVWPEVRARIPECKLHLVGSIAETVTAAQAESEGLHLVGRVDDLSSIARVDAIGLAPMIFGSGIPIKVVDYLGIGLPVVVTPGATDAFGDALDGMVAVASSEHDFNVRVVELLTDPVAREKMSAEAQRVSERLENTALLEHLRPNPI